jgi:hypothetical protein
MSNSSTTDSDAQHRTIISPHVTFVLVCESKAVTGDQLDLMAKAMQEDQHEFAVAWGRAPALFHAAGRVQDALPGEIVLHYVDTASDPSALAWHSEDADGRIVTEVSIQAVLQDGGGILDGGTSGESVASAGHHEAIETLVDPSINLWADRFDRTEVALEACDPVQGTLRPIEVAGRNGHRTVVQLSDYVFPAWFDPQAATGARLDAEGAARAALTLAKGGYQVLRTVGRDLPIEWGRRLARNGHTRLHEDHARVVEFDEAVPAWKRARILRRVAARLDGRDRTHVPPHARPSTGGA